MHALSRWWLVIRWWLGMSLLLCATSALAVYYPRLHTVGIGACGDDIDGFADFVCFNPNYLTIIAGDSVVFYLNPGNAQLSLPTGPHNVVADDGSFRCAMGCDGEGGNGDPSESFWYFTRTFDTPGTVGFHDEATGLGGVINVIPVPPSADAVAVEYYDADWKFYFETASPEEIAALDGGAFGGAWKRTGQTFNVWTGPINGAVPTCRFFSAVFAPKSTHVYTPYADECESLKANTDWQYEGIAFYLRLPDANGDCAAGTTRLYRAYNNGIGGAPNHRYTTSLAILNQMMAAGWSFEGNGDTEVFACLPQ
jgi:Repeat of unknown function (DUF5648)